jgi:hypothetical protein
LVDATTEIIGAAACAYPAAASGAPSASTPATAIPAARRHALIIANLLPARIAGHHCPVIPANDRRIIPQERIGLAANHDDWIKAR